MTVHHRSRHGSPSITFALCATLFLSAAASMAQSTAPNSHSTDTQSDKPQEGGQAPATGGSNTGGAHPAVLDDEKRPITAGGFIKSGPIIFQDIAAKAGLASWTHTMGTPEKKIHHRNNRLWRRTDRLRQRRLARYLSRQRVHLRRHQWQSNNTSRCSLPQQP